MIDRYSQEFQALLIDVEVMLEGAADRLEGNADPEWNSGFLENCREMAKQVEEQRKAIHQVNRDQETSGGQE